jgi:opacity protein-like surface antigen
MKTRIFVLMAALLAIFAVAALAADVDGQWKAQMPGRGGQTREVTLNLKADGNKLTGTMGTGQGEIEISDGKIKGDTISFNVVRKMQDREIKMNYKGKVSGDEIKFTGSVEGMDRTFDFVAKKAQ